MRKLLVAVAFTAALANVAAGERGSDPRVADLVQAGKIRIALFLPQHTKDVVTGEMRGHGRGIMYMEVARALAARLGVEVHLVGHPSPREAIECLKSGACDLGFLGINPSRAAELGFAPPIVLVPFTHLVPAGSSIRSVGDADRPGVRIAVTRNQTCRPNTAR
jgi:polar amino acid transport system substrate-binding protein